MASQSDDRRAKLHTRKGGLAPSLSLHDKISQRTARVCVLGLGYVGLPTMVASAEAGFNVTGIDIDEVRVDRLNAGQSYIEDVRSDTLSTLILQKKITATTDYGTIANVDVIVICVPTPVTKYKVPELGPLLDSVGSLTQHMHGEQLVILQSTTFPGTTEETVLPHFESAGRQVGKEFYLAFSPERIDPGNPQYSMRNTPKVVGGVTPQCGQMASAFLSTFAEQIVLVNSPKVAEMSKLLENTFRSVNIALVNELSELCQMTGIDSWEVIQAAATKPFGFMPFYPGTGVGGHCTPVDPLYLSWKAREYDFSFSFIELASRINDNRPRYVVSRITDILGDEGKPLKGARLLLLGASFKADIGDTRNSSALQVMELLARRGAQIVYSDPHVPEVTIGGYRLHSLELNQRTVERHDATVILVNHSYYDLETIARHSKLVIDAQGATRLLGPGPKVVKI